MNKLWLIITIFAFGCSKAQLPITPEIITTLEIQAINSNGEKIDSATVFIDGKAVGFTPYKNENIQIGRHALRLMKEGFQIFTENFTIEEGRYYNIEAVLVPLPTNEGELLITINLDSALVTVKDSNENVVIQTFERVSSNVLPAGAYIVSGEKPDYPSVAKAVEVIAGKTTTINLELVNPNSDPPSLDFKILEDSVQVGKEFNLQWQSNGYQVIIDQGVGARGPNGSEKIACTSPGLKVFTATAYNQDNLTTEKSDSVYIVSKSAQAPNLEFSIKPDSVDLDDPVFLQWHSDGYQVVIDQGVGIRGPNGTETIVFSTPGLKMITALAYGQNSLTTEKKDSVYIRPKIITPPSLEFKISSDSVEYGEPVQIEWITDGNHVVIDQGVGYRGPFGSEEVYFENPGKKIFIATAYKEENSYTIRQDSVFVKEAPVPLLPVVMLSTTSIVTVNSPATINWFSQNADYIVVDFVQNAALNGSKEVTFSTPGIRIVTATAFNQAGYVSVTDTIEVVIPEVVSVEDIIIFGTSSVRADKGEAGYIDRKAGIFKVKTAGKYQVFAEVWYNSGDNQLNESYYLEIRHDSGPTQYPENPNAGLYKVVPDEPGEPHTASRASGIFNLSAGTHFIDLYHYAKISNIYPQFLNGPIKGPESVKLLGFRLVYLED